MYDLISIGSVVKDIILVTDRGKVFKTPKDKLAPEWLGFELGEKIGTDEIYQNIGGVSMDISLGLMKLGFKALPFSTIGDDENARWIIRGLQKEKVKIEGITIKKNRAAPFSILLVDKKSGERVIFTQKSCGDLDLSRLFKFRAKFLFVSSLKGKIRQQTEIILEYIDKTKTELIVSPSTSQIRDDFPDLKRLLRRAKIIILNKNEALEIASKMIRRSRNSFDSPSALAKLIHGIGPEVVCITDGTKGAWASDGKIILHSPIKKVRTVDCTGAGDAFASGFLGFYLKGGSLRNSLGAGIINSASVVKYIGTTKGLLARKDILTMKK